MVITLKELRDCGIPDMFLRDFESNFGQEVALTRRVLARMGNLMAWIVGYHPELKKYEEDYVQAALPIWDEVVVRGKQYGADALDVFHERCAEALAGLMGLDGDGQDADGEPQCRCATLLWGHESGCPFAKGRRKS